MEQKEKVTLGLDVLTTILMEMEQITPEQIDKFAAMHLEKMKKGDERRCVLEDINARKIHMVARRFGSKAVEFKGKSEGAEDEEQKAEFETEAYRYKTLSEMARKIFWAECDAATGLWKDDIGIRAGWVIVRTKDDDNPLKALLGGLGMPGMD
jgi:hypothetical protein